MVQPLLEVRSHRYPLEGLESTATCAATDAGQPSQPPPTLLNLL